MAHVWKPDIAARQTPRASLESLFSYGFRPFFLGASIYAALLMTVWLAWITTAMAGGGGQWLNVAGSPFAWHAHELVFGFAAAAIAGFLLTAVPNWTGALPISGPPLMILFAVWLAGRMAMLASGALPGAVTAVIDCAFLPCLGAVAARQLLVKPAPQNLVFLAILAVLTAFNVSYHLGNLAILDLDPQVAMRNAVLVVMVMISIIGGRIIPAFTHNWLHLNDTSGALPKRIGRLDVAAIASVAVFAISTMAGLPGVVQGTVALAAALLNGARLGLWQGWRTTRAPIVWVLHLGYAWLVVGLLLSAASVVLPGVAGSIASHAFATGAIGTMTIAVMSRASLGHTGRPIVAPPAIVAVYGLVTLSAGLRVFGALLLPQASMPAIYAVSAISWITAFGVFAIVYAPILSTPRVHTKVARR